MTEFDFAFFAGRMIAALFMLPLALVFQVLAVLLFAWVFGIGRDNATSTHGLRRVFDRLEQSPEASALFLGAVVIASALLSAGLVG